MGSLVNRAEVLHANWKVLEKKLLGFGEANGSAMVEIKRQQHDFILRGLNRISIGPMPHEKAHVELLKAAVGRMEKEIWPNPVVRFFAQAKAALIDRPIQQKEFKQMKGLNERELEGFLNEKGFSALVPRLSGELDYERTCLGMKMSGQLDGDRRIELELQVVKMHDGKYYPSLIDATLFEADGKKLNHEFLLSDHMLDAGMVTNLMQGRAVSVMDRDGRGGENEVWLQVHFDPSDSYLQNFNADYGFDAGVLLKEFAVLVGKVELDDERLLEELKKGNQVSFIAGAPFNQKLLLEANPAAKQLTVRNETGEVISMQALMEHKRAYTKEMEKGLSAEQSQIIRPQKEKPIENGLSV